MVIVFLLVVVFLAFDFFFLFLRATSPFPAHVLVIPLHGIAHSPTFFPVFAEEFVFFDLFFGYEMQAIIAANCKLVLNLFTILASIDVEDELFPGKDVVFVEGTRGLLFVEALPKHHSLTIIIDL